MGFGFHRDSEHGVALFFDERGEADVFATDGEYYMVRKVETGEVRLGICVEAENLVACHLEFADGPFEVFWAADAELFEGACRGAGDARGDAAHSLGGEEQNIDAQGERATDASAEIARVLDVCGDGDELLFARIARLEKFFADVHPVEEFFLVHEGHDAVVRTGVAVENLGIDLLNVHMGAFGEFLEFVEFRVARLVHEEHAVDLEGCFVQEFFDFLDAADGDLRCCIGVSDGRDDVVLIGSAFVEFAAFTKIAIAFKALRAVAKVWTVAVETTRAVCEVVAVATEVGLASDTAATFCPFTKVTTFAVVVRYRFVIGVLAVEFRLVKSGACSSSEVALAIVAKIATAIVIVETHFVNLHEKDFSC